MKASLKRKKKAKIDLVKKYAQMLQENQADIQTYRVKFTKDFPYKQMPDIDADHMVDVIKDKDGTLIIDYTP